MDTKQRAFVRPYNHDTDTADLIHVFRETCDESLKVEPLWTIGCYIWCRPYLLLSPKTCFVVDDGSGRAVGYILGINDTKAFCRNWRERYAPQVNEELNNLPPMSSTAQADSSLLSKCDDWIRCIRSDPEKLVLGSHAAELAPWPGHLHIDILSSHQRMGLGKELVQQLLSALKAEACSGVFLGMRADNSNAARFYESYGFRRLPHTLDDGASGEMGRTETGLYYVIDV